MITAQQMNKIATVCPKCSATVNTVRREATAECHYPWQDADGTWFDGPHDEAIRRSCSHCGWSQTIRKKRGKLVSVESDPK